jgi:uncharacterized repeat protein (TIGR03803 family)
MNQGEGDQIESQGRQAPPRRVGLSTPHAGLRLVLLGALLAPAFPAAAQSYTVLHPFPAVNDSPGTLVQGSDGNFYGTTFGGSGGYGTVLKLTPTGTLTTLYSFAGSDGAYPYAGLVQATDGTFYGTTAGGGTSGYGTVFKITPAGALTTLYSFTWIDGGSPEGSLVQGTDGNFYGTTFQGGASDYGTVFRITPAGTLTTLYSFSGGDGYGPRGLVQGTDGNFYGTTSDGGANGDGTVFTITPTGTLTTLHSFALSGGFGPSAVVQGADGNFYGTTFYGGARDDGTVFKITPAGALTTLYSFSGGDGHGPRALVQGTDENFYGTTSWGGTSDKGTVFKITSAGALTTLYSFTGIDGTEPDGSLVQGTDGNFYGTTFQGGASGNGTIFKITPAGALTTLYSSLSVDGSSPYAGLVQGTDGNLYGTTSDGGANGDGTVFTITPTGTLTTLHSFSSIDGAGPIAGLAQGTDGNFYGTTSSGGASHYYGTVFKITPAGTLTTLYSFAWSDGARPSAGLVQGVDGNFYGTARLGGASGDGTVFMVTPTGTLTTLHSFAGSDGKYPQAALVQGTDGILYGTTSEGGTSFNGTVFKITPAGALTTLYSFSGSDGARPSAGLVQGTDGNFYGTTPFGGANGYGTVFKITPAGALTTLHSFAYSDGEEPDTALVHGTDGNFYGTTPFGGANGYGTVFKITPAGTLTTLHSFSRGVDGSYPEAGLVQGTDGNFYGTTIDGGAYGGWVFFRLTPGPGPSPTVTGIFPASGPVSGGSIVAVSGQDFQPGATVTIGGASATTVRYVSATKLNFVTPVHAAGAVTVTVTNPDLQAASLASAYTYTCSWTPTAFNRGHCVGTTVSLGAPTVSGATYSWTGPGGFTSSLQNPTIPNATAADAGTYSVTMTVDGCASAPGTTNVVVSEVPATPIALNSGPYCAGETISLTTPTVLGATYYWTAPNGLIYAGQNLTISNATVANAGTYSVTVTVGGCVSAPGTTNVVVNPAPVIPTVTAPSVVGAGSPNRTASVPLHAGSIYSWTVANGTITAGQGTSQITFTASTAGTPLTLSVTETNASGCVSPSGNATVDVVPAGSAALFYTLAPCRAIDTRNPSGPLGGPPLQPGATRTFDLASACGVPVDAVAVSANLAVTNVGASGELVVFPSDVPRPNSSALTFQMGRTRANNAIISFSKSGTTFSIFNNSTAAVDLILDVNGSLR